jgi:hypothetical protein
MSRFEESFDKNSPYYVEQEEFERVDLPGVTRGYKKRDGILLSNMFRNMSLIKNMPIKEDDTFVVTYPKSGKPKF